MGAKSEDDFVPGAKRSAEERELDAKIAKALDNPDAEGAAKLIQSVSPLRLLHIAQGPGGTERLSSSESDAAARVPGPFSRW